MTAQQPVLSYATRRPSESGLAPATLMAIFAAAYFLARVGPLIPVLYLLKGPRPASLPATLLPMIIEGLTQAGLAAVAAILLRTGLNFGRWFAFWAFVCSILGMQLLQVVSRIAGLPIVGPVAKWWSGLSVGGKAAALAGDLLSALSTCALLWLLWTLAKAADKRLPAAEIPWPRISRATNFCMLATGACPLLSWTVGFLQRSFETGPKLRATDIVSCVFTAALVLAAASALMKRPSAWLACTAALGLWWMYPLISLCVQMPSSQLAMMWSQSKWMLVALPLGAAQLPLLLILLVLHPCIRQVSQDPDAGPAA